eukprot:gene4298-3114_t
MENVPSDLIESLTGCILGAPPCKLLDVLQLLRGVVEDDDVFFEVVPPICLEYHLQKSSIFCWNQDQDALRGTTAEVLGSGEPASAALATPLLLAEANRLVSWIPRGGPAAGAEAEEATVWDQLSAEEGQLESLIDYFMELPCMELGMDNTSDPEEKSIFDQLAAPTGVNNIHHVFFDVARRLYVEVDPVECCCLRLFPFPLGDRRRPPAALRVEALCSAPPLSPSPSTPFGAFSAALSSRLHPLLDAHRQRAAASALHERRRPLLPQLEQPPLETAERFTAVGEVMYSPDSPTRLLLVARMEWERPARGWTGEWQTSVPMEVEPPGPAGDAGMLLVVSGCSTARRFHEDPGFGRSLHHQRRLPLPPRSFSGLPGDPEGVAAAVAAMIEAHWLRLGRLLDRDVAVARRDLEAAPSRRCFYPNPESIDQDSSPLAAACSAAAPTLLRCPLSEPTAVRMLSICSSYPLFLSLLFLQRVLCEFLPRMNVPVPTAFLHSAAQGPTEPLAKRHCVSAAEILDPQLVPTGRGSASVALEVRRPADFNALLWSTASERTADTHLEHLSASSAALARRRRWIEWGLLFGMVVYFVVVVDLIFVVFDWNLIEPTTFFIGQFAVQWRVWHHCLHMGRVPFSWSGVCQELARQSLTYRKTTTGDEPMLECCWCCYRAPFLFCVDADFSGASIIVHIHVWRVMKRLTQLFKGSKGSGSSRVERTAEEEEAPSTNSAEHRKKKSAGKEPKELKIRPRYCSGCRAHYLVCVCGNCYLCDTFVLSIRGMRHCPRCWMPICESCFVFSKGTMHLNTNDEETKDLLVCQKCSMPLALLEMGAVDAELRDPNTAPPPQRFTWGIYALLSATTTSRVCLNPTCPRRQTNKTHCDPCGLPTMPSCLFPALVDQRAPPQLRGGGVLSSIARTYSTAQKEWAGSLSEEEADAYTEYVFPHLGELPSGPPPQLLPGGDNPSGRPSSSLCSSTAVASMLCSVAVVAAEVPESVCAARLGLCDHPIARFLYLKKTSKLFRRFGCAGGHAEVVAFSNGGTFAPLQARLQAGTTVREVWSKNSDQIGCVVLNKSKAKEQGCDRKLFTFSALQSVYAELEGSPDVQDLIQELIRLRKDGIQILLCGHGLGGAFAALLSVLLLLEHTQLMLQPRESGGFPGLRCITFGAPACVGGGQCVQFLERVKLTSCFHHFVYRSDLLPRFTFLEDFFHMGGRTATTYQTVSRELLSVVWEWLNEQFLFLDSDSAAVLALKEESSKKDRKKNKEKGKHKDRDSEENSMCNSGLARTNISDSVDQVAWWYTGDIFKQHREPCYSEWNNMEHDKVQQPQAVRLTEPSDAEPVLFGCFHCFALHPDIPYTFTDSSAEIRTLLVDRRPLRIMLGDHLPSSYSKALIEYLNSCNSFQNIRSHLWEAMKRPDPSARYNLLLLTLHSNWNNRGATPVSYSARRCLLVVNDWGSCDRACYLGSTTMKQPVEDFSGIQTRPLHGVPIQARAQGPRERAIRTTNSGQPTPPATASSQGSGSLGRTGATLAPTKRVQGVNYSTASSRGGSGPLRDVSSPSGQPLAQQSTGLSSSTSSVVFTRNSNNAMGEGGDSSGGWQPGFMEGPLPSEVRAIIRASCSPDKIEDAEREARRLLSTSRRVRVYREEMQAAMEEMADSKVEVDRQTLISNALTDEITDINRRIEALMKERAICEAQLEQSQGVGAHRQKKFEEAQQRVAVLRNTIDNIDRESHIGYLLLQQMVPNLNIHNYA